MYYLLCKKVESDRKVVDLILEASLDPTYIDKLIPFIHLTPIAWCTGIEYVPMRGRTYSVPAHIALWQALTPSDLCFKFEQPKEVIIPFGGFLFKKPMLEVVPNFVWVQFIKDWRQNEATYRFDVTILFTFERLLEEHFLEHKSDIPTIWDRLSSVGEE